MNLGPPNFRKFLFGGNERYQQFAGEKIWKSVFSENSLPAEPHPLFLPSPPGRPYRSWPGVRLPAASAPNDQSGCNGNSGMSRKCFCKIELRRSAETALKRGASRGKMPGAAGRMRGRAERDGIEPCRTLESLPARRACRSSAIKDRRACWPPPHVAPPSPQRSSRCAVASRTWTAPRGDGCRLPHLFGERCGRTPASRPSRLFLALAACSGPGRAKRRRFSSRSC